jgi:RimJ/RimL family protein N-acetyltransferase
VLSDELIELRTWQERDAAQLARVLADDEVARWTSTPQPYSRDDALEWIASSSHASPPTLIEAPDAAAAGARGLGCATCLPFFVVS